MDWRKTTWRTVFPLTVLFMVMVLGSWNDAPGIGSPGGNGRDTVPDRDLDRELRAIDKARESLDRVGDIDFNKIQEEVSRALKEVDLAKIQEQTREALRKVDAEKIRGQVQDALASIDMDKIRQSLRESLSNEEVEKQMEQVREEVEKARRELEKELKDSKWQQKMQKDLEKLNSETFQKEMQKTREEMEHLKIELDQHKLDMKQQMKDARKEMDKAEAELRGYQEMIYDMEKQGLLSTSGDYLIEYDHGKLKINGKEQPEKINQAYSKYFSRDTVTIRKRNGEINILND